MMSRIALALCLALPLAAQPPAKVVFVCEHGAAKSVIAAKELEKLARERGIAVEAVTRGVHIEPEVAPGVRAGLKAEGIDVGGLKPTTLKPADVQNASIVVSFGPDVSAVAGRPVKAQDWSATPSPSENYTAARDYIVKRLQGLLDQLAAAKP